MSEYESKGRKDYKEMREELYVKYCVLKKQIKELEAKNTELENLITRLRLK